MGIQKCSGCDVLFCSVNCRENVKSHRCKSDDDIPRKGQKGIRNLGNTCYMSAAIQCMSHTTEIRKYLTNSSFIQHINKNNALSTNGACAQTSHKFLSKLWAPAEKDNDYSVEPRQLANELFDVMPLFDEYTQHDSQEFLQQLLDNVHEDVNIIQKKPYREITAKQKEETELQAAGRMIQYWHERNNSAVGSLITSLYRSSIKCGACEHEQVTFEPFTFHTVPVPELGDLPVTIYLVQPPHGSGTRVLKHTMLFPRVSGRDFYKLLVVRASQALKVDMSKVRIMTKCTNDSTDDFHRRAADKACMYWTSAQNDSFGAEEDERRTTRLHSEMEEILGSAALPQEDQNPLRPENNPDILPSTYSRVGFNVRRSYESDFQSTERDKPTSRFSFVAYVTPDNVVDHQNDSPDNNEYFLSYDMQYDEPLQDMRNNPTRDWKGITDYIASEGFKYGLAPRLPEGMTLPDTERDDHVRPDRPEVSGPGMGVDVVVNQLVFKDPRVFQEAATVLQLNNVQQAHPRGDLLNCISPLSINYQEICAYVSVPSMLQTSLDLTLDDLYHRVTTHIIQPTAYNWVAPKDATKMQRLGLGPHPATPSDTFQGKFRLVLTTTAGMPAELNFGAGDKMPVWMLPHTTSPVVALIHKRREEIAAHRAAKEMKRQMGHTYSPEDGQQEEEQEEEDLYDDDVDNLVHPTTLVEAVAVAMYFHGDSTRQGYDDREGMIEFFNQTRDLGAMAIPRAYLARYCEAARHLINQGYIQVSVLWADRADCPLVAASVDTLTDTLNEKPEVDLTALLERSKTDQLDESNKWRCDQCHKSEGADATHDHSVYAFNDIAFVYLTRFKKVPELGNVIFKVNRPVTVPSKINLGAYSKHCPEGHEDFEAYFVIAHAGNMGQGHYWGYVRTENNQWFELDDAAVKPATEADAFSNAYIVAFRRVKPLSQVGSNDVLPPQRHELVAAMTPKA